MFDKMKQMYDLQKKAREIQKKLEAIRIEQTEGGHTLAMNGLFKVESLKLDPASLNAENKEKLEKTLEKLISAAIMEAQRRSALESKDFLKGLPL
jgi:DNA-binding protein YbaB